MNLRQIKRRTYAMMTTIGWNALLETNNMWHIRHTKPCNKYTAWCTNCNAYLFPRMMGRFPRDMVEFNMFEQAQQEKEGV